MSPGPAFLALRQEEKRWWPQKINEATVPVLVLPAAYKIIKEKWAKRKRERKLFFCRGGARGSLVQRKENVAFRREKEKEGKGTPSRALDDNRKKGGL